MSIAAEITHMLAPTGVRTEHAFAGCGLVLWFGYDGSRIQDTGCRHWLVRPARLEARVAEVAGFEAVFDELEFPVPDAGMVLCTMRPKAPRGAHVDHVLHGLAPVTDPLCVSIRGYGGVVPADVVWARLRNRHNAALQAGV